MPYIPTEADLVWAQSTIDLLREGGQLIMPGVGSVYEVSHEQKTVTLRFTVDPDDESKVHERSKIVFAKIGYEVKG